MNDSPIRTQLLQSGSKELLITSVDVRGDGNLPLLPAAMKAVFNELAPYAKNKRGVTYVRDFPERAISKTQPGSWARNDHEFDISLPDWQADPKKIVEVFAAEMHHLVRYQTVGVPKTLGDTLALEATARAYAASLSGLTVPWTKGPVSQQAYDQAKKDWSRRDYDHQAWFLKGPLGKWIGYRIAHRLGKEFFRNGFDLQTSLSVRTAVFKKLLP